MPLILHHVCLHLQIIKIAFMTNSEYYSQTTPEEIKEEFRFFLSKSVKTTRSRDSFNFTDGTVHNYLTFCDSIDTYVKRVSSNKYHSVFEITNPQEISDIAETILSDESFIIADKEKNVNGLLSGALMYYVCFINTRTYYFDKIKDTISKQKNASTKFPDSSLDYSDHIFPYLSALRAKPFVLLAGISGTGKSRIVRKLAQATNSKKYAKEEDRWNDNRPDNFELIQVKPNWHNSMDVVGFYSSVSERYEFTPFVRFIVKAWQHLDTPYFLCLDEMNLAPVEEYFAEFLSAIESRSKDENGEYITDPIIKPFYEFGKNTCEAMLKDLFGEAHYTEFNALAQQFTDKGLTLPRNLMVMGTVNMDETTFTFSRKVLDRAMSMEMNEVDYDAFLLGETETMPILTEFNSLLVDRPQKATEVKDDIEAQRVVNYLKDVNALFEGTPFKLGYRAANEAMLYISANQDFTNENFSFTKAIDEFTLMKILSRVEGDDSRLSLDETDERITDAGINATELLEGEETNPNLLHGLRAIVRKHIGTGSMTEKKINAMLKTLEREHFVSYWN